MKCKSCNVDLSDFEATRKHAETKEYIDLCNRCFKDVKHVIPVIERHDLEVEADTEADIAEGYDYDEPLSQTNPMS